MKDDEKGHQCRRYVGIDSAWGGRQPGAIAYLEVDDDGRTLLLRQRPERFGWDGMTVAAAALGESEDVVVAIDQPLVVTNATGMRPVERAIAQALLKSHGLGAYPANLANTNCFGPRAGIWRLLRALEAEGVGYDPAGARAGGAGRLFFECYPHPALLGIFDLSKVLPYKVHKGDLDAWDRLRDLLEGLAEHPALPLVDACDFLPSVEEQTKENEDRIDALVCAYTAAWVHRMPEEVSALVGDLSTGAIVTPVSAGLRKALETRNARDLLDRIEPGATAIPYPPDDS